MAKKTIYPLVGGFAEIAASQRVDIRIINDRRGTTDKISIYDVQLCEIVEEVLGAAVDAGCDESADKYDKKICDKKIYGCVRDAFVEIHKLVEAIKEKDEVEK